MRDYIIMTDSCCDLTDHMARELELTVVPPDGPHRRSGLPQPAGRQRHRL